MKMPRLAATSQGLFLRENQLFLALVIVIGVLAGLTAVLFALSIDLASHLLFGTSPPEARLVLVPVLMSLVTGVLLAKVFKDARGSGVPLTEAAYHLSGGYISNRTTIGKFVTGVLCIGSGHSLGPEGPSVQIGAGVASMVGRWLKLPPARMRSLIPVAGAAALAAAFNTPVAAVVFALEEIIGDMNAGLLGSAVIASVSAAIVERSVLGNEPLFHVPSYQLVHPTELIAYAALGVIGGVVSLIFGKGLLWLRTAFRKLPAWSQTFQPAIGGLAIGLILLVVPQVMGVGYPYVDQALNGGLVLHTMILLCAVKILATIISQASGNAGGIFAPSLFFGAMLGGAVGVIVHRIAPFPTGSPGAYALVGMGTLFAGIIRAPMTSVFMVFEITQDYQILVPLMVANMLSYMISRRYQPTPIYHALLEQDHVHLPSAHARLSSKRILAREIMTTDVPFVAPERSIDDAHRIAAEQGLPGVLVGGRDRLVGLVGLGALKDALRLGREAEPVSALLPDDWPHVHPDHPFEVVVDRLGQAPGILPVVSRADTRHVEGVITADRIIRLIGGTATTAT